MYLDIQYQVPKVVILDRIVFTIFQAFQLACFTQQQTVADMTLNTSTSHVIGILLCASPAFMINNSLCT